VRSALLSRRTAWSAALVVAGIAFIWVISVATLKQIAAVVRPPQRVEVVIPLGTADRVRAGQAVDVIPANLSFVMGDVLVLKNQDTALHTIGPYQVAPGQTLSIPLDDPTPPSFTCSIHPSGVLNLQVQPRDDLRLTLVPTLVLGVPLGIVMAGLYQVLSRMA
jgi:hypothetical protein